MVRNDNYGGDFNQRFQNSLNSLSDQLIESELFVELVLVNYNPIENKPSFEELIKWPTQNPFLSVRMITVPHDIHCLLLQDGTERLPLPVLEFMAKNIGIRRASAPYVLCTNADIIFDKGFFQWLVNFQLREDCFYRADRFDFMPVPGDNHLSIKNIKKIYTRLGQFNTRQWIPIHVFLKLAVIYGSIGRIYAHLVSHLSFLEPYRGYVSYVRKEELFLTAYHFHACGDFTLTSKENWARLRGYPEDTFSAMHTDSLFLISCIAAGLKEIILPFPVFHQIHTNTFEHNAREYYQDVMFKRLIEASRFINGPVDQLITNAENWGMGDRNLSEIRLV